MLAPFRRYRDTALVVLLLAVPFFFLRASIRQPEKMNAIDRTLARVAAPIEFAASAAARGVTNLVGDYGYLVDVKADNNKLSYENAQLRSKVSLLYAVEAENKRLKNFLGFKDSLAPETVSAVVVAKGTTNYFRVTRLTLDRPAPTIKESMPVLSLGGVVGTIQRIAGDKVDVQLAVDSGFGVDVIVERTGARGFVRGTGNEEGYDVYVEYVRRDDDIDVGDVLLTSGFGCRFPSGLGVAKVTEVIKKEFGIYQRVKATPTVDFSRLQEVLIVLDQREDCVPQGRPAGE
ncbi:MAG: rod shape-determining protein MreC [Pseudomonadota bacterium]|jgi:rod shape-determining protein MreC